MSLSNVKPLNDRIVVRRDASDEKTKGGLLLPEQAKKKPQRGTILAVGPGKMDKKTGERHPMQLKAGDKVLFTSWAGDEVKQPAVKEGDVLIMHEEDVLAVIG